MYYVSHLLRCSFLIPRRPLLQEPVLGDQTWYKTNIELSEDAENSRFISLFMSNNIREISSLKKKSTTS